MQILYGWLCISPNSEHIYTQLILSAKHHRRNFLAAYLVSNWPQCEYIFKDFLEQYMHPTPIPFPSHLLSTHHLPFKPTYHSYHSNPLTIHTIQIHLPFKSTYHSNPLIIQTHLSFKPTCLPLNRRVSVNCLHKCCLTLRMVKLHCIDVNSTCTSWDSIYIHSSHNVLTYTTPLHTLLCTTYVNVHILHINAIL